ncbi:MAG: carboxypeptidase regulatory-like domain-containing protein [Candidatus Cloacimonetes bacterium]|nr:carboxypeptidase regulatory-like domain-containing protein [Candidatus Cloacimonadota bacterium]
MKKTLIIIFLLFIFNIAFAWRTGEMEIRVQYSDQNELKQLIDLHPKGDVYPHGEAVIYLIPTELEVLKATGLKYKIISKDIKSKAENFWLSQDKSREEYHTYSEIVALADSLSNTFPDIVEKHLFGISVQGRELGALKISDNVTLNENEAEIMFDGGIHGDEIGGPENIIRFARDLCLAYDSDPIITNLINSREIWLYYMVNPDGRVADDRENANGVDLNRDSGYMWDAWGSSPGAFSQPESKALRDCHYNRQFVVHTTYHSGTEYISCPWSYRADQAPDYDHIMQLAGEYSSASGYAIMEFGQGCTGMYPINGSTKDTNYGMMGAISWSMEISYDKNPPANQITTFYNYNKPAMLSMIEHAGYGLQGIVTDASNGEPVAASVFINDYFPCYTDATEGDYHKYVLPGTYEVKIVANGYETQTISGITVTLASATTTDFQLQPVEGQFVYKVAASQIPDNNSEDEGDTPGVIGAPDNRNYSLGKDGWIIVDMQFPIPDCPGNDLIVIEGDPSPESFSAFASNSIDGPWLPLGEGYGSTEFDLADANLYETRFIKIVDDGDGLANVADAGFDLDAVESIAEESGTYIAILGYELEEIIGNGNGYIDPGETLEMTVTIRNNGSLPAEDVTGILSTPSDHVLINDNSYDYGDLTSGEMSEGSFSFTVDTEAPLGGQIPFNLDISANAGSYTTNFDILCLIGVFIEDFETYNFQSFEWEFGGNADWIISNDSFEGSYSAVSSTITHNQSSALILTTDVTISGEISFYHNVSSESGWDFLNFFIDDALLGSWSGISGWEESVYPVTAGTHTFKWSYEKDGSVSNGSDCGWIDYIIFPPMVNNVIQGLITGNVTLEGGNGEVENVIISAGDEFANPNITGEYSLEISPGIYNVQAELEGYSIEIIENVTVEPGLTVNGIDFILTYLDLPNNLEASIVDYNDVVLTWEAPATDPTEAPTKAQESKKRNDIAIISRSETNYRTTRSLLGYKIYKDDSELVEIDSPSTLTYSDEALDAGDYVYTVTALYDEGESVQSAPANVTITLPAPINVSAQSQDPNILLSWEMAAGRGVASYTIYRNTELLAEEVTGSPYEDTNVVSGNYIYNVVAVFDGGWESEMSANAFVSHTGTNNLPLPEVTALTGNYPNPFNPETTVSFSLSESGYVSLTIYNMRGQLVKTLINNQLKAAYHDVVWDGSDNNGKNVSSGIYFYKMQSGKYSSTRKMILMK